MAFSPNEPSSSSNSNTAPSSPLASPPNSSSSSSHPPLISLPAPATVHRVPLTSQPQTTSQKSPSSYLHARSPSQSSLKLGTTGSPGSQNSPDAIRTPPQKQKGPQKVRFPMYNNPETKKVHLPSDETTREAQSDTFVKAPFKRPGSSTNATGGPSSYFNLPRTNQRPRSFRSPLTTPPINHDHNHAADDHSPQYDDEDEYEDEAPLFFDSRPPLSRNQSSQRLLADHEEALEEAGELASRSRIHDSLVSAGEDARSGMFDVGLITSGGLAPGAGIADRDARAAPNQRDQFAHNRQHAQTKNPADYDHEAALATTLNTHYNSGSGTNSRGGGGGGHGFGPYGDGINGGSDIPLLELQRKLTAVANDQSEEEGHSEAPGELNEASRRFAALLVREHSRHLSSRPPSPGRDDHDGMTVPASQFWQGGSEHPQLTLNDMDGTMANDKNDDLNGLEEGAAGHEQDNMTRHEDHDVYPDGTDTPRHEDYVPAPSHVRQGVLGSLLKLYGNRQPHESLTPSAGPSAAASEASTPKDRRSFSDEISPMNTKTGSDMSLKARAKHKWYKTLSANASSSSLAELVMSSNQTLMVPGDHSPKDAKDKSKKPVRPKMAKRPSALEVMRAKKEKKRKVVAEREAAITFHIADVLQRQRFILRLCRALMLFGAPTHRLEEYMKMTSRVLGIDGQFLYIPGCMICSFGDSSTHTSEMQLVRCVQGVNLHKLHETHAIYKKVIHGETNVEEASKTLEFLLSSKNLYTPWMCVLFFGLASLAVGPFAFGGRWHDMPISFLLGTFVGILQIVVAPRSALYNNVFEVSASIIVSFLGRAFGSIGSQQDIFCFAAIAQSSLALILPGYIILCGSLELQSRNIVAGSVRMFYAIIYSLFLGFGITLGAAIYGWIDHNATSETTCPKTLNPLWRILFVPMFTLMLALVNQAHWRQLPPMLIISGCGYVATYFSGLRLSNASELTSAIGALVIGVLGNMYSRVGHGLAFAAMLPAIFVQVPSGVASQGSLIAGIDSANSIVSNSTSSSSSSTSSSSSSSSTSEYGSVMNLGITMVQVSIGITVGLFVATLVIYPFGKKRSGLFTF